MGGDPDPATGGDASAFRTFTASLTESLCKKLSDCGVIDSATQSVCKAFAQEFDPEDAAGKVTGFTVAGQTFRRTEAKVATPIPKSWEKFLGSYGPDFIPLILSARHDKISRGSRKVFSILPFVFSRCRTRRNDS